MKKADSGFTLVELMIVLLVLGILVAVGLPAFSTLVQNYRITAQANDLTIALALARSEAIRRNLRVVACRTANPDNGTYNCGTGTGWQDGWIVFVDSNGNCSYDAGEQVLLVHAKLSGSNQLSGNQNIVNRVCYSSQGNVGAGGIGAFLLTDSRGGTQGTRLVCVAMTGRTRVFSDGKTTCPNGT